MGMVGIITSSTGNAAAGTTSYVGLQVSTGQSFTTAETRLQQVVPCAGTIDYLRAKCVDPGGAGQSRVFTVRKNGVSQTLTATVNTGSTSAQDTTHSFSVVAGDLVDMEVISSASTASSNSISWVVRFTAANNNEYPLLWGALAGPAAGATRYSAVQGDAAVMATEATAQSVMPTPGTISKLYAQLDSNMTGGTMALTLVVNGIDTALTCTVASGASTANDTSNSVAVVAGDTISFKWVNTGSNAPRPRAGVKFAPTTDGESVVFVPAVNTQAQNLTRFQSFAGAGAGWSTTESPRQNILIACLLRSLYVQATGIASGQTFAATVRKNTASTTITATITGTGTTANDTTHTDTAADDDLLALQGVTSATSGTVTPQAGLVLYVAPASGGGKGQHYYYGMAG